MSVPLNQIDPDWYKVVTALKSHDYESSLRLVLDYHDDPEKKRLLESPGFQANVLYTIAASASGLIVSGKAPPEDRLLGLLFTHLDRYLEVLPEAVRREGLQPEQSKRLFLETLEVLIRHNPEGLREEASKLTRRITAIDAPRWGWPLALACLMEKLHSEHIHFERPGNVQYTRVLAEAYLEVSEPVAGEHRHGRAMVMNLLSDLAYFEGGDKGEEEALAWARKCLEIDPGNLFARKRRQYIEERRVVEEQIRRFRHDTNNALAGVSATLQRILRLPEAAGDPLRGYLKTLSTELNRIHGIHRFIEKKQAEFTLCSPVDEVRDLIAPLESKATFDLVFNRPDAVWETDLDYFRLALYNVLRNSVESFDRHGIPPRDRRVRIEIDDDTRRITVSDNAGGIDPLLRDRIFSPYVSSKGIRKETGLGLSQARMAMESMEGSMKLCEMQPEDGAAFELSF